MAKDFQTLKIIIVPKGGKITGKYTNENPRGTFDSSNDTVTIRGDLPPTFWVPRLLHEVGHYLMKDVPDSQIQNLFGKQGVGYRRKGYADIDQYKEDAADAFSKWMLTSGNQWYTNPGNYASQPYYRYQDNQNIYEKGTNRKIDYQEAKKKNIWHNVQIFPQNHPNVEQDTFFKSLTSPDPSFNPFEGVDFDKDFGGERKLP